jgi:CDP-diacylglycerol--glycerol-3-phosphate 3-phosphatidyltransferase
MNVPNKLTVSRLFLTVALLIVLFLQFPFFETVALALFIAASLTDLYDGKIARRDNLITNFGILMDPLADKILVCSVFIAFIELNWIEAWIVVIIVVRELAITGLRLLAASKNVVLAAESYGKHKTTFQIVTIIAILTVMSYPDWGVLGKPIFGWVVSGKSWSAWVAEISKWVTVVLTIISGSLYLWKNRKLYLNDM